MGTEGASTLLRLGSAILQVVGAVCFWWVALLSVPWLADFVLPTAAVTGVVTVVGRWQPFTVAASVWCLLVATRLLVLGLDFASLSSLVDPGVVLVFIAAACYLGAALLAFRAARMHTRSNRPSRDIQ
jgi:hypothetical protein